MLLLLYQIFDILILGVQWYQYALAGSLLGLYVTHISKQWFATDSICKLLTSPQRGMGHGTIIGWYTKWLAGTAMSNTFPIIVWDQNWLSLATCVQGPFILLENTWQCCPWRDKLDKLHLETIRERQVNAGCLSDLIMC